MAGINLDFKEASELGIALSSRLANIYGYLELDKKQGWENASDKDAARVTFSLIGKVCGAVNTHAGFNRMDEKGLLVYARQRYQQSR